MSKRSMGLRRSTLTDKRSQNKKGRGWRGSWQDRLTIPKAEATPILLTRGEYPMKGVDVEDTEDAPTAHYHTHLSHGVALRKSGPGSFFSARCNLDAGDTDCLLCFAKGNGDRRINTRYIYSFNVLHLALYERTVKVDAGGKPERFRQASDTHAKGDPILTWTHVTRPKARRAILDNLEDRLADGREGTEGGARLLAKKYIEVGRGHRDQLVTIDEIAGQMCRCGGHLIPMAFSCEACGEELMDVQEADMEPEEVLDYAQSRQRCPDCGHVGLPVSDPVCDLCNTPTPLTAFDVVAWVRRKGEGTSSRIEVEKVQRLDEFEFPDGSSLIKWESDDEGDFPVEDDDGDWVFTDEHDVAKLAAASWNFEEVHSPKDHEYVASRLGIAVPPGFTPSEHSYTARRNGTSSPAAAKYRNYGSRVPTSGDTGATEKPASRRSRRGRKVRR